MAFLVKISISQVFLDPIQNRLSARSADLEAPYLEALLYNFEKWTSVRTELADSMVTLGEPRDG